MYWFENTTVGRRRHGVKANVLDGAIQVSKFALQSHYYVHFRTNIPGKGMNSLISPAIDQMISLLFFNKDGFGIK